MKKTIEEKLMARKIKAPPRLAYGLLARLWKLMYFKKLGMRVSYKVKPKDYKGPYIVVGNHASRLDYIYAGIPFLPHRLNFVVGYNEFFRSHLAFIFRFLQVIPKRNFVPDYYTLREITRRIKAGGRVIIFPEGMSSISGANQPCALGGGKMLKHFGVPVLMVKISGGYLTSTKYCLDERPGRVDVEISELFSPEKLAGMTADQVQRALDDALWHDDYEWNMTARAEYDGHGQLAKNMHDLLYRCPRCGSESDMLGEGDVIRCRACGNGARLNARYELVPLADDCVLPQTPRRWVDMERECAAEAVRRPGFFLESRVRLGTLPEYEYLKDQKTSDITGEGLLRLDGEGLSYTGTCKGESFTMRIPPKDLPTYGMCTDVSRFYTFYKGKFYEFYPENGSAEKWLLHTEELHRANGGAWKDFEIKR